jgi:hypothetical protein
LKGKITAKIPATTTADPKSAAETTPIVYDRKINIGREGSSFASLRANAKKDGSTLPVSYK